MKELAMTIEVLALLPDARFWAIVSVIVLYLMVEVLKLFL